MPDADLDITLNDIDGVQIRPFNSSSSRENSSREVEVTVSDLESAQARPTTIAELKETSAKLVALVLVYSFAGTIALSFLLVIIATAVSAGDVAKVKTITEPMTSIYEALGKFLAPVFGPLLGFVLGYYFSKEQKEDRQRPNK